MNELYEQYWYLTFLNYFTCPYFSTYFIIFFLELHILINYYLFYYLFSYLSNITISHHLSSSTISSLLLPQPIFFIINNYLCQRMMSFNIKFMINFNIEFLLNFMNKSFIIIDDIIFNFI